MEKFCDEVEHSNVQVVESEKTFNLDISKIPIQTSQLPQVVLNLNYVVAMK